MRCSSLVMPASSAALACFFPVMVLIRVDLPTLGTPQIKTRMGRDIPPRWGASSRHRGMRRRAGAGSLASMAMARVSAWALYHCSQAWVCTGSATSCLLSSLTRGLWPVRVCSRGLKLEPGMRASSTSMTTSMALMRSSISWRVRCMWPGYHWMNDMKILYFNSCFRFKTKGFSGF